MDRFKFRAWNNKEKKWLMGYELSSLGGFSLFGECVLLGEWAATMDKFLFSRDGYKPEDLIVMQGTGLKDKNGKDIYEGDIGIYRGDSNMSKEKGEVVWMENRAAFGLHLPSHIKATFPLDLYVIKNLEVIGNIYENPDLLSPTNPSIERE